MKIKLKGGKYRKISWWESKNKNFTKYFRTDGFKKNKQSDMTLKKRLIRQIMYYIRHKS